MSGELDRFEGIVNKIFVMVQEERSRKHTKRLTEPQVIKLLNVTKRKLAGMRKKNITRRSSVTGKESSYVKPMEEYIYDHCVINRRAKA
jgi:hypothetical protein